MKTLWKIIRAMMGKEEYKVDVKVEIDVINFLFILLIIIAVIWMMVTL
jgi:hypothetical protein